MCVHEQVKHLHEFFFLYSPWMRSASEMEIWLFDPGHQAERSRKTDQERGIERERLCVCLCVCVFSFLTPSTYPISSFALGFVDIL